jgi:hypothetical protein
MPHHQARRWFGVNQSIDSSIGSLTQPEPGRLRSASRHYKYSRETVQIQELVRRLEDRVTPKPQGFKKVLAEMDMGDAPSRACGRSYRGGDDTPSAG